MPHTQGPGPAIYFETSGSADGEPLVLIEGLTAQMIGWRDGFVAKLVARGMFVIRLDNRDVGLSEQLSEPDDLAPCYTLEDMADDVCRVLDTLGIATAHIVGQSMGGAIAQRLALNRPERVRSMVLFYTAPAFTERFTTDEIRERIGDAPPYVPMARAEAIELYVEGQRLCGSTGYAFDEVWQRELGALSYDRCHRPDGHARQAGAVMTSQDVSDRLPHLSVPTAIIHGRADRLVKVEAGLELARLIPDAELHIYPGMGHTVEQPLWDEFATIIMRTARR